MISVASEMTKQTFGSFEGSAQLPAQVVHDVRIVFTYFKHLECLSYVQFVRS